VQQLLRHGDLIRAQEEAQRSSRLLLSSSPDWARKFKVLQAEALLLRGMYPDALALLIDEPNPSNTKSTVIEILALKGAAHARLHHFNEAERNLTQAEELCTASQEKTCGQVLRARGVLALQQGQPLQGKQFFEQSLAFARLRGDQFLEATALLNIGLEALAEQHFDEAIDATDAAYRIASALGAEVVAIKALGNLGWAYYNLGDAEKSLDLSLRAEERSMLVGDVIDELSWITNAGYVYQQLHDYQRAKASYLKALGLARKTNGRADIYNALRALALVSVQSGQFEESRNYAEEALSIGSADHNRLEQLYPLLVKALIASETHNVPEAEHLFREVEADPESTSTLKWRAKHGLALLYEGQGQFDNATTEYRAALATIENARLTLKRDESKLPFSSNATRIYDDYVHFLISRGKTDQALQQADYGRARALAEGLGLLSKNSSANLPSLNVQAIAREAGGNILFYWLGEKQSYLWAITPHKIGLFILPPGAEIDAAARRYRKALGGPQNVLDPANTDGRWLYTTLLAPVQSLWSKGSKVFIIPDGSLNNLNFETLPVPAPVVHYWIEDATIVNASSLRLLASSLTRKRQPLHNLLLIGNSIAPNEKYPELPKAALQMDGVAAHFPVAKRRVLARDQATPAAYLASDLNQYSHIHFVAHGTASRLSPLDSAIILSPSGAGSDSFKLYARDIIREPLRAQLVTISSCYGAGERSYSGEGLVGLSWAFLRAGAHNVIAALWEATDVSTEQLMGKFYDQLDKGMSPDAALRAAKLSLLRESAFRNPFYWAPFQLYAGS